ncbi:MAG TPA: 1-acyl-sn-glycerol-3-phosphate acyltransferase [Thermoanaerobaculia bacterium]|nr:1-acyl-sn-glycerol-3-phosphate acyltransferase [Thermoanaerobaculia bacterium]
MAPAVEQPQTPRTAQPAAPGRWLFVGPADEVSRRLAARPGMAQTPGGSRFVPAGGRDSQFANAAGGAGGAGAAYAAAFAEGATGGAVGTAGSAGTAGSVGTAGSAGNAGWDAVVYRPPRRAGSPALPDLADAAAFFSAFLAFARQAAPRMDAADTAGGAGRAGDGGLPRVVLVSSAAAVSPGHHHPGWSAESERPPGRNPIARAWLDLEALAAKCLGSLPPEEPPATPELIVLRPAAVAAADGEDELCRVLRGRAALVPAGFDPTVQLLSPDDLAAAVEHALERGAGKPGIYHVAPAGALPLRAALRLAGARRLPLGVLGGAGRLDYLRHSSTVSGGKIERELGFAPRSSSAAAIVAELAPRGGRNGKRAAGGPPAAADLAGLPDFDPYGQDKRYIAAYGRTLFRFLHDAYWRIEHEGLGNVPREGRAVLTGIHRGFMPWDGVMALHLIARELGRHPRFLIHPCLVKFPFLANYMTKLGGLLACQENADWVLENDELLGMFPEGIQGAFTMYRDAYRLGKFGRDEYVKMALRQGAPIVPFVTVGSAEIYPILGRIDSKLVRRVAEWPFLPLAPNFPLPGLPLPSKWHTRFLEPLPVGEQHPPEAAEDPEVVRAISREVRARMEAAIRDMLARRKSIFRGAIFDPSRAAPPVPLARQDGGGAV